MGALPNYAENTAQEQAGTRAVHDLALKSEKAHKLSFAGFLCSLAPRPGLEPGTCGLTESRARQKILQDQRFIAEKSIRAINRVIP